MPARAGWFHCRGLVRRERENPRSPHLSRDRALSDKRENDDPHRYQGGHAGDGHAEVNTADSGLSDWNLI